MSFSIRFFFVFCLFFKYSYTLECSSQPVDLDATHKSFVIQSDPNDLAPKTCKYTFSIPNQFVPTIHIGNLHLTGGNKITVKQYSEFGGNKNYEITESAILYLAPVNFTIEISLPKKTAEDTFAIAISVKDATPASTDTFVVGSDVGTLIDSFSLKGNMSLVQTFDNSHQAASYSMKIALFTYPELLYNLIQNIHVYDVGTYKGNLLDVYLAPNASINCSGSKFSIINTNPSQIGVFTLLISEKYEWDETQVFATSAPTGNYTTQVFTATNGLTVFQEISSPIIGGIDPVIFKQFTFRGDGELNMYAGCVTGSQEPKRIATITPSNAVYYDNLLTYGRCRTYVLSKGVVQWTSTTTYPMVYNHQIGQKGIIMSNTYPYPNNDKDYVRNYLIQGPYQGTKEHIIVTYEVAQMAPDVSFNIDQEIKGLEDANKTLTSSDTTYTSVSTYQQYIVYTVPKGSNGFLVRYTVTSSTSSIGALFVMLILLLVHFY